MSINKTDDLVSMAREASRSFEVHRFTRHQHNRGDTTGWRFEVGWFRNMGGLEWAWFSRDIDEEKTTWK